MALRIFDTDPTARPKPRTVPEDVAGRFRAGRLVSNRPESLATWRITTQSEKTAQSVSHLFGGSPQEWATTGDDHLEVITEQDTVRIIVDSPDSLSADMRLWGPRGLVHHCDGVSFLSPDEDIGKPCGCPDLLADRKAFHKSGRGPGPCTSLLFRLAEAEDLGVFRLVSTSWKLAEVVHEIDAALKKAEGPALAELSLELVQFRTKAGVDVAYRKPVVKVTQTWRSAATE